MTCGTQIRFRPLPKTCFTNHVTVYVSLLICGGPARCSRLAAVSAPTHTAAVLAWRPRFFFAPFCQNARPQTLLLAGVIRNPRPSQSSLSVGPALAALAWVATFGFHPNISVRFPPVSGATTWHAGYAPLCTEKKKISLCEQIRRASSIKEVLQHRWTQIGSAEIEAPHKHFVWWIIQTKPNPPFHGYFN
ncbi:LAMI_0F05820g1_1 [Lachancea mirantina]|uniref:LAMI_0F05820g1_1 n=1 Tax=Lachancea mirantina TaxID=1230905 RepID=A0A1G4JYS4_9SACH|nr:LAMI_0F05820g1_1 [Lachancea mirantina]